MAVGIRRMIRTGTFASDATVVTVKQVAALAAPVDG